MKRTTRRLVAAAALTAATSGILPLTGTPAATAAEPGPWFGAYVQSGGGWTAEEVKRSITSFEAQAGRKLGIDHHYQPWSEALPGWEVTWDHSTGRRPMVSLDGPDVRTINSGSHDAWIRRQADAVKATGKPVLIRFLWEMDIRTDKSRDPATFIAAWRRVRTTFVNRGATNAQWVWCPTAYGFATGEAQRWYPGDAHVEWICADGYNWGTASNGKWRSFKEIYAKFYAWAAARPKPLMVGETGTQEGGSGWKGNWYKDTLAALKAYPRIRAFVYFHSRTTAYHGGTYDWRTSTTWSAQQGFKTLATSPYFVP